MLKINTSANKEVLYIVLYNYIMLVKKCYTICKNAQNHLTKDVACSLFSLFLFCEDDKKNLTVSKPFLVVNLTNTQLTELFFFSF